MRKMSLRNEAASTTVSPMADAFRIDRPIVAIWFFSLAIRGACAIWFSGMIDKEGAEYARIAQNLLAGAGYVGIATPGEQLFFPPLFPLLILAVTPLTGDAEIAGRIVSIVFGSLVVVPVYLIAQRMYSERVAIAVAALVGIHPLLVEYSTTLNSEPTYLTIVLTAVYLSMRAMDNPTLKALFLAGAFYGLAYLVRTEASAYMLVACTLLALRVMFNGAQHRASLFRRLPVMLLGFLLFAGPYIAWLSVQAGQFRVESKTSLNLPTELLMQHGMSGYEAQFGVEPDLTMRGIYWQSSVGAIKTYNIKTGELPLLLARRAKTVAKDASAVIGGSFAIGSPALFGLAILGLFSRTWTAKLALDQVHLGIILALVPFAMLFTHNEDIRLYIIFVPVLCLWGTYGVLVFSRWARKSTVTVGLHQLRPGRIETASRVLAVSTILLPSAIVAIGQLNADRAERPFKEALANLAAGHPALIRIASTAAYPAFEAHAEHVWLPYCDEQTARLFLTKAGVTHVVLGDWYVLTPYQKKWMEEGVPKAHQIANLASKIGTRLKIYELDN
jgi:4-amino-4-deoxy-L-arabinose transferase-like glycosyltransferase